MLIQYSPAWTRPDTSWCVKAARALEHLRALEAELKAFRKLTPYTLTPERTERPGRLAYRLHYVHPFPTAISAITGDVLANLRAALECLAYGVAAACHGGSLPPDLESRTTFPIAKDPAAFERFFQQRPQLYTDQAKSALRIVQPFIFGEECLRHGVTRTRTYDDDFVWSQLHRLDRLWNIDKHRRLNLLAWWPDLLWWGSNGDSQRTMHPGDGTLADGSVLFYMHGEDPGQGTTVHHEFNIVLTDDPAHLAQPGTTSDLLRLLTGFYDTVTQNVFPRVFTVMSQPWPLP
ncbi:hypothetical protein ACQEVU_34415 [Dactylosporangium sp. CA-139066]